LAGGAGGGNPLISCSPLNRPTRYKRIFEMAPWAGALRCAADVLEDTGPGVWVGAAPVSSAAPHWD